MKKIAIISLLNFVNTNYGNRLQSYALNNYINSTYREITAESIVIGNILLEKNSYNITFIIKKIPRIPRKILSFIIRNNIFNNRLKNVMLFLRIILF